MLSRYVRVLMVLSVIALLLTTPSIACSKKSYPFAVLEPIPLIPAAYYKCMEVLPSELLDKYFSNYGAVSQIEALYNEKFFVFKNNELTEKQISNLKNGYIWIDMIKCTVKNTDFTSTLKTGDKVDVVGINKGLSLEYRGLVFSDCIVVLSNTAQLPAPGEGGGFTPGY